MPWSAPSPCAYPGCAALVRRARYCADHARTRRQAEDAARPTSAERGYGARWRRLRSLILDRDPFCVSCRTAAATQVDHIVPRRVGGTDSPDNLQGLCARCHSRKTAREDGGLGNLRRSATTERGSGRGSAGRTASGRPTPADPVSSSGLDRPRGAFGFLEREGL